LLTPSQARFGAGEEGLKKNPQASHGRLGILPACTLHRLSLEDCFVKNIQAGFLTLGSSYFLRLPILSLSKDSGLSQVSSPITAAGPSPIFPVKTEITEFPSPGYHFSIRTFLTKLRNGLSSFFNLELNLQKRLFERFTRPSADFLYFLGETWCHWLISIRYPWLFGEDLRVKNEIEGGGH
jgi:hypothetical protein